MKFSKLIRFAILTIAVLLVFAPEVTNAGWFDIVPSASDLIASLFKSIIYVFNFIGATLFTLAGMLVNLMLDLNLTVLDDSNTLVHVGWQLVRDIANLGFVLVIIVIAFATILRFEQYGISKLLPKLIAAAIIVNFSFAIAAAVINFTDVLTNFFAERALSSSTLGAWDLSGSLSNAFGPQRFFIEDGTAAPEEDVSGGFTATVLTSITSLVFVVVFTLIGAFVLFAFAFMLLLRYLYLTFLVILAPLVWLFWVIPALGGQFNKWWNSFLRWSFFAPAMMFFVYLALISVEGLGNVGFKLKETGNFFTGVLQNTMIQGAQMVVLSGLLIGGLIIAQKMGIIGAAGAMGLASKTGAWTRSKAASWSGRQALRAGTAIQRSAPVRGFIENLQKGQSGLYKAASYVGGRKVGNALSTLGVVQGGNLIRQSEERQKGLSDEQLALRVASMNNFDRVAALSRLAKSRHLEMVPDMARYISDPNTKAVFESYGKKKEYEDMEKTFGANNAMLTAKTDEEREDAAAQFYTTLSKSDWAKVQFNNIFQSKPLPGLSDAEHSSIQKAVTHGIAKNNPGDMRKVFANVKSTSIKNVKSAVEDVRRKEVDLAEDLEEVMKKSLGQRRTGELFEFEPPAAGSAAA